MKLLSLRSVLLGELTDFLQLAGMSCLPTQQGLAKIIDSLSQYREEGKALFPQIYIFDDFEGVKRMLPRSKFIKINEGPKEAETLSIALKKCAPLTSDYWSVYILRQAKIFEFGVFTSGTNILSVSPENALIHNGTKDIKVILLYQVSDKMVEIKSPTIPTLVVNFGIQSNTSDTLRLSQQKFINSILANANPEQLDQMRSFFEKVFILVTQQGHGTLAATISSTKRSIPKTMKEGIILSNELDVSEALFMIKSGDKDVALEGNRKLDSYLNLIAGMLMSDLVTLFRNDGKVVGYNIFIKHPTKSSAVGKKATSSGGARSKTYEVLKSYIGKDLVSTYFQSQDGKTLSDDGK